MIESTCNICVPTSINCKILNVVLILIATITVWYIHITQFSVWFEWAETEIQDPIDQISLRQISQVCRLLFPTLFTSLYPPKTKLGGVYWNHNVRLSVRPSVVRIWVSGALHNCFPFTPIIMKLHMQTPHESRMCPIDFEVKRSKVKVTMHKLLKMVSGA